MIMADQGFNTQETVSKGSTYFSYYLPIEGKTEGPSTCITYLGVELDTVAMTMCLPQNKLSQLKLVLEKWKEKKAVLKRDLLRISHMNFISCLKGGQLW